MYIAVVVVMVAIVLYDLCKGAFTMDYSGIGHVIRAAVVFALLLGLLAGRLIWR